VARGPGGGIPPIACGRAHVLGVMPFERTSEDASRRRAPQPAKEPARPPAPLGDMRALASAMGNQQFARMIAREPAAEDPERCAIDVCAVPTPLGAMHLFIVYTNEKGVQYGFRAGPDLPGGILSYIEGSYGTYTAETFQDFDPQALTVRALSGNAAQGKGSLLSDELILVTDAKVKYEWFGPNSNTVVSHLLTTCGIPRVTPVSAPVGWDAKLFGPTDEERQNGRGGAEGSGPEGNGGAGGAGGY